MLMVQVYKGGVKYTGKEVAIQLVKPREQHEKLAIQEGLEIPQAMHNPNMFKTIDELQAQEGICIKQEQAFEGMLRIRETSLHVMKVHNEIRQTVCLCNSLHMPSLGLCTGAGEQMLSLQYRYLDGRCSFLQLCFLDAGAEGKAAASLHKSNKSLNVQNPASQPRPASPRTPTAMTPARVSIVGSQKNKAAPGTQHPNHPVMFISCLAIAIRSCSFCIQQQAEATKAWAFKEPYPSVEIPQELSYDALEEMLLKSFLCT